jgi:hypothetical protein
VAGIQPVFRLETSYFILKRPGTGAASEG